ncbi:HEAT repeat domain-containing protein [Streptomyces sp. NPDC013978]|uniref:HEAT repeat domain-containing protein n=1 Tax=Streptomyces sp. NPDC013978 TaxID=3364869 RepID=UPI0036F52677
MGVVRGGGADGAAHQIAHFLRELAAAEPGRRAAAVKGLGRVGRWAAAYEDVVAGVAEAVVRAAQDPAAVVRAGAADALGRLGHVGGDGAGAVIVGLMGDPDGGVRRRASLAAERLALEGPDVVGAFRRLMSDDSDWHLRLNGLLGLARREGNPETAVLIRLLGDTGTMVWGHARIALYASLGDRRVREQVLHTARYGRGMSRARALDMLPSKDLARLRGSLLDGLRDECPGVRGMSASKLPDDRRSRTAVLSALAAETDAEAARQMLHTLGWWGEERAEPLAVRWLDHPESGSTAVWALARIDTSAAWELIRTVVVSGPGPGPGPGPELWPGLGHHEVRTAAARALGERPDPRTAELLLPLLRDPDERIRAGAVRGLMQLGQHEPRGAEQHAVRRAVVEGLLGLLTTDEAVLHDTRNALSHYPEALPAVRRLIDHPSDEVRAVVVSLLDLDEDGDVRLLLGHLHDPSESVRYQALYGISRYVDAYGELPEAADRAGLLGELEALAHGPHSSVTSFNSRLTAGRILDKLEKEGKA